MYEEMSEEPPLKRYKVEFMYEEMSSEEKNENSERCAMQEAEYSSPTSIDRRKEAWEKNAMHHESFLTKMFDANQRMIAALSSTSSTEQHD